MKMYSGMIDSENQNSLESSSMSFHIVGVNSQGPFATEQLGMYLLLIWLSHKTGFL
jgi:hypothetical protein